MGDHETGGRAEAKLRNGGCAPRPGPKTATALPCKMSNDAIKQATLTSYVINADRVWHVAPKQPGLKSDHLCCSRYSLTDGL